MKSFYRYAALIIVTGSLTLGIAFAIFGSPSAVAQPTTPMPAPTGAPAPAPTAEAPAPPAGAPAAGTATPKKWWAIAMRVRSRTIAGMVAVNEAVGSPGLKPTMVAAAAPAAISKVQETNIPSAAAQPTVRRLVLAGR